MRPFIRPRRPCAPNGEKQHHGPADQNSPHDDESDGHGSARRRQNRRGARARLDAVAETVRVDPDLRGSAQVLVRRGNPHLDSQMRNGVRRHRVQLGGSTVQRNGPAGAQRARSRRAGLPLPGLTAQPHVDVQPDRAGGAHPEPNGPRARRVGADRQIPAHLVTGSHGGGDPPIGGRIDPRNLPCTVSVVGAAPADAGTATVTIAPSRTASTTVPMREVITDPLRDPARSRRPSVPVPHAARAARTPRRPAPSHRE